MSEAVVMILGVQPIAATELDPRLGTFPAMVPRGVHNPNLRLMSGKKQARAAYQYRAGSDACDGMENVYDGISKCFRSQTVALVENRAGIRSRCKLLPLNTLVSSDRSKVPIALPSAASSSRKPCSVVCCPNIWVLKTSNAPHNSPDPRTQLANVERILETPLEATKDL